jgi:glycerol-3-phosphate acyltransferase PlsY
MGPVAYLLLAFLAGSLPFGLWIARLARGVDVRAHGSGNIGATNVLRVAGIGWGILALALDIAKGWVAVALLPAALGLAGVGEGGRWPVAGAVVATGGHVFSPWVGFRGGKGVATFIGAALALSPAAAWIAIAGFVVAVALGRYVSVGSIVMAALFPLAVLVVVRTPQRAPIALAGAALAILIAWRHRANWARLARGEESKLGRRR